MKIDPYYQQQKCRSMTLLSGSMRFFADIRGGPLRRGRQTTVELSITAIFSVFAGYFFGYFRDEASVITLTQRYAVRRRLFSDPKCMTLKLNDLEWLFRVKLFSRPFGCLRRCDFRKIIA